MFYDKVAEILDADKQVVGTAKIDLQPYIKNKSYTDSDFRLEITHRAFLACNVSVNIDSYFRHSGIEYKVITIKQYSDYLECWLYECGVA